MTDYPIVSYNELSPAGIEERRLFAIRQKEFKKQIREILGVDHKFNSSGQGATWGMHNVIRLLVQTSILELANAGVIYAKDSADDVAELHFKDEDGNEIQITSHGHLLFPLSEPGTIEAGMMWIV